MLTQMFQKFNTHYDFCFCDKCENVSTCEQCFKKEHNINERIERPNRNPKCADYYLCKFGNKYISEYVHLLRKIDPQIGDNRVQQLKCSLGKLDSLYKILSIGCGPCTDLLAFIYHRGQQKDRSNISYHGIDLNSRWNHIQKYITDQEWYEVKTKFSQEDIFQLLEDEPDRFKDNPPNILSLQYVLSTMKKQYQGGLADRIDILRERIVNHMLKDSLVIINDIKEKSIIEIIESFCRGYNQKVTYYFDDRKLNYGDRHSTDKIVQDLPKRLEDKYDYHTKCTSVQFVIQKA